MRALVMGMMAIALAACGTGNRQPVNLSAPTAGSIPAVADCVRRELVGMGYQVGVGQPPTVITGLRSNRVQWYMRALGFRPTVDQITVTLEGSRMDVVGVSSDTEVVEDITSLATDSTRRDAERLQRECSAR